MKRERKSAKAVVEQYTIELLQRSSDAETKAKLLAVETIALRMGWNRLYNNLRFRPPVKKPWYLNESD